MDEERMRLLQGDGYIVPHPHDAEMILWKLEHGISISTSEIKYLRLLGKVYLSLSMSNGKKAAKLFKKINQQLDYNE